MTKKTRRVAKARRALLTLSLVLVVAFAAVGGTIAWLTAETDAVVNTFGNTSISIDLKEHEYDPDGSNTDTSKLGTIATGFEDDDLTAAEDEYKMVPGVKLPKDPFVYVNSVDSEDVWVAVSITKSSELDFDLYMTYAVADDWVRMGTSTDGNTDYYIYNARLTKNNNLSADGVKYILKDNVVNVLANADMSKVTSSNKPTLTFKAYAVQADYINEAGNTATTYTDAMTILKDLMDVNMVDSDTGA